MSLIDLFQIIEKGGPGSGNFGHSGILGKIGGSTPGGGIPSAKSKILERAGKLNYGKVAFEKPNKKGLIQVVAGGPAGGKPKKLNLFIDKDGKIVDKTGKELMSFKN